MDLSAIDLSAAGLRVQRRRMDLIASNLANGDTTSARQETVIGEDGQPLVRHVPYRRKIARVAVGAGGVPEVRVVEDASDLRTESQPGHPHAGADGIVRYPNVDPLTETVDLIAASRAYEANLTAIEVAKAMHQSALRILG
ncbi:MAG TPA: flagellar basal body rod protein FlgC [Planctomycetota bacterium]|nr:flagellar basal body rod protein FlgC [Planctomycetota bacterium]